MSRKTSGALAPRLAVVVVAFAGMVAGTFCAPAAPSAAAPPPPESASTIAVTSTAAPVSAPPTSAAGAASSSASASGAKGPPVASASAAAQLPLPKITFPKVPVPIAPSHGGKSWAVFLVLGPLTPERAALADAWWATQKGVSRGMGCHEGTGAPGQEEPYVALYFKTEKDAKAFAAGTTPPPVRIAQLKTYCLD